MGKRLIQNGKVHNGMNPDREMPGTQKQGIVKSIRETIQTLKGK